MTENTEKLLKFWASTTFIAVLVGCISIFSYVHNFVFTRVEGTNVEKRLDYIETRLDSKLDELSVLSGKLDAVILLQKKD